MFVLQLFYEIFISWCIVLIISFLFICWSYNNIMGLPIQKLYKELKGL